MKHIQGKIYLGLALLVVLSACSLPEPSTRFEAQSFSTAEADRSNSVATLGTGAVIAGWTYGNLGGLNKGSGDAFIRRYQGGVKWTRQFGTHAFDGATNVATDSNSNSYALGYTLGNFGGRVGNEDIFLRKFGPNGSHRWTRQFGTTGFDLPKDIVIKDNAIYTLSTGVNKLSIHKWDENGNLLMTIHNNDWRIAESKALVIDSTGNLYVLTRYLVANRFVANLLKYDSSGNFISETIVFNPLGPFNYDLIVDSSDNFYLVARIEATDRGAYLRKLTKEGVTLWTKRLEPTLTSVTNPTALALDSNQNVYVGGYTNAAFSGFSNAGAEDVFVLKYSPTGTRLWAMQKGGSSEDYAYSIAVSNAVYLTGHSVSNPNLSGSPASGSEDAFLIEIDKGSGSILSIDQ